MPPLPPPPRLLRWLVLALLVAHLVGGLARQPRLVAWALTLARLDLVPRGALAADERANPQAAVGQIELRRQVAAALARGDRRPSPVAYCWGWLVAHRDQVPPVARVFFADPEVVPYYYGNFLWHPARLEVTPGRPIIRDETTLHAAVAPPPAGLARDYDFLLSASGRGLALTPLPRAAPAAPAE